MDAIIEAMRPVLSEENEAVLRRLALGGNEDALDILIANARIDEIKKSHKSVEAAIRTAFGLRESNRGSP